VCRGWLCKLGQSWRVQALRYPVTIPLYQRVLLIYNPLAGGLRRKGQEPLNRARATLAGFCREVLLAPTTGPRTAAGIVSDGIANGADLVIAAGGDGTINEVAEALVGTAIPLAILPAGTANVLAMETRMGRDLEKVAALIPEFVPRRIAVGKLVPATRDARYFLLMAGAGLDAHIVYHLNAALKSRLGKIAYWIGGCSVVGKNLSEFTVDLNGESRRCSFALISRVRNYGGDFEIACGARLTENTFEAVLFEGRSSYRYLKYLGGVVTRRLAGMRGVQVVKTTRVTLSGMSDARIYLQVDGEYAGRLPATIELLPDAITLLLPRRYLAEGSGA
jgi:diacylglycerol kinase (ATP)